MSLVDLVEHSEHCMSRIRRNEAELDAKAANSVPFTRIDANPLEKNGARIYTPKMFRKVRYCIRRSSAWEIEEHTERDGLVTYRAALKEGAEGGSRHVFFVECSFHGSSMNGIFCGCRKLECEGVPCSHIFSVLSFLGVETIPPCCVRIRWTMQAKAAFVSETNANTHVWSEEMGRYRQMRNKASVALFKASKSEERLQQVMDFLQSILDRRFENDGTPDETAFGPIPSHYSASSNVFGGKVLDPKIIVTKGAPSKKRMKPFHETLRQSNGHKRRNRSCGECGDSTHDRRTCPKLK